MSVNVGLGCGCLQIALNIITKGSTSNCIVKSYCQLILYQLPQEARTIISLDTELIKVLLVSYVYKVYVE